MKNTKKNFILILQLVLFIVLVNAPAGAQFVDYNHPELKWETIETEHHVVHFHNGLTRTPRLIAKIAEEIYEPITKLYKYEPGKKIHWIVKDHDDYANGITYYYDNKIVIWATPLDFLLRGTSDWLRDVVTHEFTHMIQLQAAMKMPRRIPAMYIQEFSYEEEKRDDVLYGFPKRIISYPFAGAVMPMWFAEGTAQHGSRLGGYDRWDSHRDMILRTRALNNEIYSLDEMGVFGKNTIGNESVYNLGFSFTLYLAERFGEDILLEISKNMSSFLAFKIDGALEKATGVPADELYNDWRTKLETDYLNRTDSIRRNLVQGKIFDHAGAANVYPAWSPDGSKIAYLSNDRSDYFSHTSLFAQDNLDENRDLLKLGVVSPPSWSESGNTIAYSRIEKKDNNSFFYDVYLFDMTTEKETQVTTSMRAKYPVLSRDAKTVYFVSGADGMQNLYSYSIDSEKKIQITNYIEGEELFNSSVSPDGKRIAFAVSDGFGRDIAVVNTDGTGLTYILNGKIDERDPAFSPDGKKLYFSSDRTGIYNIYEYDFNIGQSKPVTNVTTGAFMPSVNSSGEMIFALYTEDGFKLSKISSIEYVDASVMVYKENFETSVPSDDFGDEFVPEYQVEPYTTQYMTSFFVPRLFFDYGKPKLGFYSFSSDALDKYSVFFGAAVNKDKDRDLFALFDFNWLSQTIFLEMYNMTRHTGYYAEPDGSFPASENDIVLGYWEVDIGARQKISETQNYEFRTAYSRQSGNIETTIIQGGRPVQKFKPFKYDYYKGLNFGLRWEYRKILPRRDSDINPAFGRSIKLDLWRNYDQLFEEFVWEVDDGTWGKKYIKYNYDKIVLDWKEYIGLPFISDRTTLVLNFDGGWIDRPVDDFLYFFAGGLPGIRGYSFYSLQGRKMMVGSATLRTPLIGKIGKSFGPWYFDKLYGSIGYYSGDAWDKDNMFSTRNLKSSIDFGLRLDMFSYYGFPTKIGFDAAYGLEEIEVQGKMEGKDWRYFLTVLFGYDLF
ncbi:hypothetical protein ACFL67_00295 [candidate division KSB1 bacterium]